MTPRIMYDAIAADSGALVAQKPTMAALYLTGGPTIQWTSAEVVRLPTVKTWVRIDQGGAGAPQYEANVMDVETGAYTVSQIPGWLAKCTAPRPTVYCTRSTLPSVKENAPIWLAAPGLTQAEAVALAATDKRIVAVQNFWGTTYDTSVVVDPYWPEKAPVPTPPKPPIPHAEVDGFNLPAAASTPGHVPAVIKWLGTDGVVTRQSNIPEELWDQIPWSK
jgi:hypothetical protein